MKVQLERLRMRLQEDYLDLQRKFRKVNELPESKDLTYKKKEIEVEEKYQRRKMLYT